MSSAAARKAWVTRRAGASGQVIHKAQKVTASKGGAKGRQQLHKLFASLSKGNRKHGIMRGGIARNFLSARKAIRRGKWGKGEGAAARLHSGIPRYGLKQARAIHSWRKSGYRQFP